MSFSRSVQWCDQNSNEPLGNRLLSLSVADAVRTARERIATQISSCDFIRFSKRLRMDGRARTGIRSRAECIDLAMALCPASRPWQRAICETTVLPRRKQGSTAQAWRGARGHSPLREECPLGRHPLIRLVQQVPLHCDSRDRYGGTSPNGAKACSRGAPRVREQAPGTHASNPPPERGDANARLDTTDGGMAGSSLRNAPAAPAFSDRGDSRRTGWLDQAATAPGPHAGPSLRDPRRLSTAMTKLP